MNRNYQQPHKRNMNSSSNQLRVVLIGKTGNGKSSTGNSLLHSRTAFHSIQSAQSITRDCEAKTGQWSEKEILVVDTPGFFDTDEKINNQMVERKIASQIFQMTSPGVHAFLIILRIDRFSPEEKQTVDFIRTIFGTGAARYCIVIFTREDQLEEGQSLDNFISSSPALQELVTICGDRKLAINNKLTGQFLERKTQQLLRMIEQMVNDNNGTYYTNAEYQRIEQQRIEEQRRREEAELARKKAYEEALIAETRERERRRAEQLAQQAREEERRKAEQRIKEAEEEARRQKEQREREERARREAEEARRQAEERARREAEERTRREAEERARREAEERTRREAEEARRQAEQRARRDAEERARRDAETARMQCARSEPRSAQYCQRPACYSDDDDDPLSASFGQMEIRRVMGSRTTMVPVNTGMSMPRVPARPFSSGMSDEHGGRYTGEFMATRGSANGRPISEGSRGGLYYTTASGKKSYIRK